MASKYSFCLYFEVKGIGEGKSSVLKSFHGLGFKIISISDITGEPHNGCRVSKTRRI
jgi:small subunit ribosomal protein S11